MDDVTDGSEWPTKPARNWLAGMNDGIEWVRPREDAKVNPVTVDVPEARALTVGPDEVLVVVFPQWATPAILDQHRERFTEVLGSRFILVAGDDVQLAKIPAEGWAPPALERGWR